MGQRAGAASTVAVYYEYSRSIILLVKRMLMCVKISMPLCMAKREEERRTQLLVAVIEGHVSAACGHGQAAA